MFLGPQASEGRGLVIWRARRASWKLHRTVAEEDDDSFDAGLSYSAGGGRRPPDPEEKPAFIFCVEDRALFCRDCDEPIHVEGSLSGDHQRLLATGISVALSSACKKIDSTKQKDSTTKPSKNNSISKNSSSVQTKLEVPIMQHQTPSDYTASTWSVDEFLQLSDYESGDKKGSTSDFGGLDWFADIGVFPDDMSNDSLAAAEVPEISYLPVANNPTYFKPAKSASVLKKPRIEISDDEEFFVVPDLG